MEIMKDILIGVVSGYAALYFALKRFYFEKMWERKETAYSSIFNALHDLKNHVDHELAADKIVDPSLRPKVEVVLEELKEKMVEGTAEIRKRVDIGAFVISEEAVRALNILLQELDASTKAKNWNEHLNLRLSAVNKCLDSMRSISKNDLKGPMTARECFNSFWRTGKK